jgi:pimeloyl-ACP methyl ester carboxylesterase
MAGGGPIGCTYEMGALRALEEAIDGLDLRDLAVYVGISSGAFIAAGLANRLDTAELCRIFITGESTQAKFRPEDFLRPASVRLEHGRTDSYSYRHDWFDFKGLQREVLDPAMDGKVLPSLWNAATDRASRAEYVDVPENGVVLVDGTLMLDRWLPAELTVHLWLSPGALKRRTAEEWTLPAFDDYEPVADLFVRYDHPERPGLVES